MQQRLSWEERHAAVAAIKEHVARSLPQMAQALDLDRLDVYSLPNKPSGQAAPGRKADRQELVLFWHAPDEHAHNEALFSRMDFDPHALRTAPAPQEAATLVATMLGAITTKHSRRLNCTPCISETASPDQLALQFADHGDLTFSLSGLSKDQGVMRQLQKGRLMI